MLHRPVTLRPNAPDSVEKPDVDMSAGELQRAAPFLVESQKGVKILNGKNAALVRLANSRVHVLILLDYARC